MKTKASKIIITLLAFLLIISLCSCISVELIEPEIPEASGYREFLDDKFKGIYDTIYKNLKSGIYSFDVDFDADRDDRMLLQYCFMSFIYDHTELLFLGIPSCDWKRGDGKITLTFKMSSVNDNGLDEKQILAATQEKIDEISSLANHLQTDYDKILFVHDYIINHTEYVYTGNDVDLSNNSAYSCLVKGESMCSGYAAAFNSIMHRLGIDCLYIYGTANNGKEYSTHAWNLVCSNGEWYMIDLTWDDIGHAGHDGNEAVYNYFCITSEEASADHYSGVAFVKLPECTSTELNYHYRNNCVLEKYSVDAVSDLLKRGEKTVKFTTAEECNRAIRDLFGSGAYKWMPSLKGKSLSYYAKANTISFIY